MTALLDTNVLLDFLLKRNPGQEDAIKILQLANAGFLNLLVTDLTIANIAYITRREIAPSKFYQVMLQLSKYYTIIPIGPTVVDKAFVEHWDDFEDSLQCFAAELAGADYIITRNVKDFVHSSIKVYSPSDFLKTHFA